MAQKRQWTVPEDLPEHGDDIYPIDRQEAQQAFLEAEAITQRLGGSLQIAPIRTEVSDGRWITRGYAFRHVPYVPAERAAKAEPAPVEELPDAEPVAA
ncbi:MAG: hypothetical protein ACXWNS_08255 [Isosphaeraceae bacterium]